MTAVVVAEGVAIALLAVVVLGLLRSHALILRALHELGAGLDLEKTGDRERSHDHDGAAPGPVSVEIDRGIVSANRPPGTQGADIAGTSLDDESVLVPVTGSGRRTLLAFLSSGCSVCETFWSEFGRPGLDVPDGSRLVVVAKDLEEESESRLRQLAGDLELVLSSRAWADYGVPGSPYFVHVEDGRISGEGSATSWTQVRDLMGQSIDDTRAQRARVGRRGGQGGGRDDLSRMDRELTAAGLHPGHPSLYDRPDSSEQD